MASLYDRLFYSGEVISSALSLTVHAAKNIKMPQSHNMEVTLEL
ncbi:hypothetical protein O4H49_13940 [Kiloniella laminariae]|uniref:Uncharacterized protein n=1 Tax=Kiloniella laminariae TaxID=454162 RepID=A0ABT4LLA4_9PROT|nr:hypothetical protein [Kiloniella laminariae]MCZ4281888.1 hypothetical protein [Kiloniella laminariae]